MKSLSLLLLLLASFSFCTAQDIFPPGQSDNFEGSEELELDSDMLELFKEADELNVSRLNAQSNWEPAIEELKLDIKANKVSIQFFEEQNEAITHDLVWLHEQAKVRRYEAACLRKYVKRERYDYEADQIESSLADQAETFVPNYSGDEDVNKQLEIAQLNEKENEEFSYEILERQQELLEHAFIIDLYEDLIDESEAIILKYEM